MKTHLIFASLVLLFNTNAATLCAQTTFDFESLPIPASGFNQGDVSLTGPARDLFSIESSAPSLFGNGTTFTQRLNVEENGQSVSFSNTFENDFSSFTGFATSNVVDQTTVGFGNQFAAFPGSGADGSDNYLISFGDGANLVASLLIDSIDVTNTTFAALAALGDDGSGFVSGPLEDEDGFFSLTIQGNNAAASQQEIIVDLADYRDGNDLLLDAWQTVDVSGLQSTELTFGFLGSDRSDFGLRTPTYFAIDNIVVAAVAIPEPGSLLMIAAAGFAGALRRRRSIS